MKALALAVLAACGTGSSSDHLSVGWMGPLPTWQGRCQAPKASATSAVQQTPSGDYLAVAPGTTQLACAKGSVRLIVRAPTALTITAVTNVRAGQTFVLTASVMADAQPLALGDALVSYALPPELRAGERCSHGNRKERDARRCLNGSSLRVTADKPGSYTVTATFGALRASSTISVQ